jgi:predicted PurR-regulated permease PerM
LGFDGAGFFRATFLRVSRNCFLVGAGFLSLLGMVLVYNKNMLKDGLQSNYQSIRGLIKQNVNTIITLVEQAQTLEKIVDGISDSTTDAKLKNDLEAQISQLRGTIAVLVDQTETLFESYDRMVQTAFKE